MKRARPKRAGLTFARPKRASPSFASLLYLPPLWRVARPRSERSVGGPVIICLLFHLPTFMARSPSEPAYNCLSALFAPVMARSPSSERALRRRPSYHLSFVSLIFAHLHGARPERASLSFAVLLNLSPLWRAARAGQFINALLLYMERGLSFAWPAAGQFVICPNAWFAPLPAPCEKSSTGGGTPYYSI